MGLFSTLFGKNTDEKQVFSITTEDKKWVDDCFKWLLKNFGYPAKDSVPYLFNAKYFPLTFRTKKITVENLLDDLCGLYLIDRDIISFELIPDIRDIPMTPREIQGKAFESDTEIITNINEKTRYNIHLAKSLTQNEFLLLRRLVLELTQIKINEKNPDFVSGGDLSYFNYIASVFFGFGVLISKALVEVGVEYRAGWQRTWRNKSEVPFQVVSYALANYSKLMDDENPEWKKDLPSDVTAELDAAMEYLIANPDENTIFSPEAFENELKAKQHHALALKFNKDKQFTKAITEYELAIPLVVDKNLLTQVYINLGYAYLMIGDYEKSLPCYFKALELRPNYSYALANMGYIYTITGQLEKAKECLDKVDAYDDILNAYLLRDWALYYIKAGNDQLAEEYFTKAFDTKTPVDLLEYFYAKYLLSKSEPEEAMRYLAISVDKKEAQGIELMESLAK